jgi:hypothetical protein
MNIPEDYFDIADKLHQITDTIPININDILEEFDDIEVQYVNYLEEPLVIKHDGGYLFKTIEHPSWKQRFVIAKHLAHLLLGHEVAVTKAEQALDVNTQEIAQATNGVNASTTEADVADTTVNTAKDALTQAGGKALADASNTLTDANKAVSDAQDAQAKAQVDVDAQESIVTRTNDERVNSETDLATAQDNVTIKTNEVASAKDALVNANQAIRNKEDQIKTTLADYDTKIKEAARSKETKVVADTRVMDPVTNYENETKSKHEGIAKIVLAPGERTTTVNIPKGQVENIDGLTAINYTPNVDAITGYLVDYINELRENIRRHRCLLFFVFCIHKTLYGVVHFAHTPTCILRIHPHIIYE